MSYNESKGEIEALKKEVEDLKKRLEKAENYISTLREVFTGFHKLLGTELEKREKS